MKRLLFLLLAATATAATLPLYIDTATNTVVSPDAPTVLSGYGITDALQTADIGVTVQAWDQQLDDIAAITATDGNFQVGNGSTWVAESGDTAQESLGLIGTNLFNEFAKLGVLSEASGTGVAMGSHAIANGDGRVQIGEGINSTDSTIQFRDSGSVTEPQFGRIINIADSVIIVDEASDFSGTLDSTKIYLIDGIIDMGSQSIEIPAGGISIKGFSFDVSKLTSSAAGYTMFTSPIGGSGNMLGMDYGVEVTGVGSQVFDVVSDTGNQAIEFVRVNWNDCTSMGTIDNYRQGLETGTGRFGGSPNLILKGVWSGGYFIDTSIVRALDAGMTGALYEAGAGFSMASRFRSNQNIDLPASAAFLDFAPANFPNPSSLQLDGCLITRNGVKDPTDSNLTPNIAASDLASSWMGNSGLTNTFVGGETFITVEATTTIATDGVFVDVAGTFATTDLQHFDSPAMGQLRHLGDTPISYTVSGQFVLECSADNIVNLKIVIFRDATTSFEDGKTTQRVIDRLAGARNVAYFVLDDDIILNQNDYVKLQVANIGATNDITAELDSYFNVKAR